MGSGASIETIEDELKYSSSIDYEQFCKLSNENGVSEIERDVFYAKCKVYGRNPLFSITNFS